MTVPCGQDLAVVIASRSRDSALGAAMLRGRVCVVIGASRGMGKAIALGYAREQASLAIIARGRDELEQVAREARDLGAHCVPIAADARDGEQTQYACERVEQEFGRVDVLVHTVGGGLGALGVENPALRDALNETRGIDFWRIDDEDFESSLASDLRSVFLSCKYFARVMIRQRSGSIIVVGSYGGIVGSRGWTDAASQTCKAGVHRFVAAVADELQPYNVTANVLVPGLTLTSTTEVYPVLKQRATQTAEDCIAAATLLADNPERMTGRFVEVDPDSGRLPERYMPIMRALGGQTTSGSAPGRAALGSAPRPGWHAGVGIPRGVLHGITAAGALSADRTRNTGRALRHRNFRLFFFGQAASLPGTWMQRVAIAWLAFQLTGSPMLLGLLEFAFQVPVLLCGPIGGVAADRVNRKTVLLWTQSTSMGLAAILTVLALSGAATVWHLVAFTILQGVSTGFDQTARRTLLLDTVDEDKGDLASAIGLNSALQMGARTIGPALAGILLASLGGAACFLLNTVSYVPIVVALLIMPLSVAARERRGPGRGGALWEGLRYTLSVTAIKHALLLLVLGSLFGIPFMVVLPVFSTEVLDGGPQVFGFLTAASGAGSLVGAAYVAGYTGTARLQWLTVVGAALLGSGLVGLASAHALWFALMFAAFAGFGMMLLLTGTNTLVQTNAADDMRGRTMSWYTTAFNGSVPFGSVGAGALTGVVGAATTLLVGGAICLIGAAAATVRLARTGAAVRGAPREEVAVTGGAAR